MFFLITLSAGEKNNTHQFTHHVLSLITLPDQGGTDEGTISNTGIFRLLLISYAGKPVKTAGLPKDLIGPNVQ